MVTERVGLTLQSQNKFNGASIATLPRLAVSVELRWDCNKSQFAHHKVHPMNPAALKPSHRSQHDTYAHFRSHSLEYTLSCRAGAEEKPVVVLLYAKVVR